MNTPAYPSFIYQNWGMQGYISVNSTMENHRQWRITRRDIAEFLETLTNIIHYIKSLSLNVDIDLHVHVLVEKCTGKFENSESYLVK